MGILSSSRIKALWDEYRAMKDGRIHTGHFGDQVHVHRTGTGWIITVYGVEAKQRELLQGDLESAGIPSAAAEWVAGRCPVDLLPERSVAKAIAALERFGEDDYEGYSYFSPAGPYFSSGVSTRTTRRYTTWP